MRALFTSIILLCLVQTAFNQTRHDLFIVTTHNDSLDATYYVPATIKPSNGYPALLFVHGFGLSKDYDTANCVVYAKSGYETMCYSVRGHGKSMGGSTIMSVKERADLADVINFLMLLPEVDSTKIGLSGGSQGGLHGLWAISDDLPVRAVSSDVIVPHWASDMLMNGSVRRTVLLLLQSNIGVRFDPIRDSLWSFLRTDDYDSFASHFIPERDLDTAALNRKTIPSLRLLKWQDYYFSASDGITSFLDYTGSKKLYMGTYGHFSDIAEPERFYQSDIVTRWFNYFLRDIQNGILEEPTYTYAYSQLPMDSLGYFTWTRNQEQTWPPSGIERVKLYLARDSMLLFSFPTHSDTFTLANDYLNPAYTFDTAYIEGFKGPRFDVLLPKHMLQFSSHALENDVLWIGAPNLHAFISSNNNKFPLHAQIYEVDSTGRKYFINRINYTARHWQPSASKWITVEGIEHAHKFKKGNRIRIELTNIDKTNRQLLGTFPFVVPMFAQTSVTLYSDPIHQTYIELPLIGNPTSVDIISDIIPQNFPLIENYPNPFNPITTIHFTVNDAGFVTVKVFDVVGREVETLVEEYLQPGLYKKQWDAFHLSSGVYLCRITIKPDKSITLQTQIHKMMLIR